MKRHLFCKSGWIVLPTVALMGCAAPVVQSTRVTTGVGQVGLVYALPKAQVQLVAQRKVVDADEVAAAKKEVADLTAAAAAAKSRAAEAKGLLKDADDTLAAVLADAAATAATREELQRKAGIAKAVYTVMDARLKTVDVQVTAAVARAHVVLGELGQCRESASLTLLPFAPDPEARYLATHASNAWRDDQLTLSVSSSGLLNTSTAQSTDQTGAVILSLVQGFAAARAGTAAGLGAMNFKAKPTSVRTANGCSAYKTTLVFDPTLIVDVTRATRALAAAKADVSLCVDGAGASAKADSVQEPLPGYAYRASRPVRINVTGATQVEGAVCASGPNIEAASLVVHVPDASTLFVTPVTSAPFTKVSNKHTFKDGMLLEVSLDKPSMVAAIASLPVEILKALVSIPASMIKLRVDYESQSAALVQSQTNVLKAQVDLLNAQKALDDRLAQDAPGP